MFHLNIVRLSFCLVCLISSPVLGENSALFTYPNNIQDAIKETFIYTPKSLGLQELKTIIRAYNDTLVVEISDSQHLLLCFGKKEALKKLKKEIKTWDPDPQLLRFETTIVEIAHSNLNEFDSALTALTDFSDVSIQLKPIKLSMQNTLLSHIRLLETKGQASLIAQPLISVLNNKTVSLLIGDQLPYITEISRGEIKTNKTQQINTGISITLSPRKRGEIIIADIYISISDVKIWKEISDLEFPILSTREFSSTIKLEPNKALMITGLSQTQERKNTLSVPLLGRIPLIKYLFSSTKIEKVETNILIFIKPSLSI